MKKDDNFTAQIENKYLKKIIAQLPNVFFQFSFNDEFTITFDFIGGSLNDFYEIAQDEFELDAIRVIESRIHEDDLAKFKESFCNALKSIQKWDVEHRVILPIKGLRWMKVSASVEKLIDNKVIFYGVLSDITEEKIAEEAHRITDERSKFANMASNVGVWDWNLITNEVTYSPESLKILELEHDGKPIISDPDKWDAQVHPDDRDIYFGNIKQHFEGITPYYETCHRVLCNGKYKWILDRGKVISRDKQGKPLRIVGTHTDISPQKEKEQDLLETVELINNQKNKLLNFAYIVSHNLKNHAGNLRTLLTLNENNMFEKEEFLTYVKTVSDELSNSIDNLAELIKVQDNQDITKDQLNLKEYLKKVFNILMEDIHRSKVSIIDLVPEDATVFFNAAYLESILLNLTTNAIKYSSSDRVPTLTYSFENVDGYKVLSIKDNGLGIDLQKYREHLFGLYKTFHSNKDSNGIGLHITKNQLDAMEGKIEVESVVDEGSVFKVFFKN